MERAAPVTSLVPARTRHARHLFSGIPSGYDTVADLLSFGQNARWRHAMVTRVRAVLALLPVAEPSVLDVAAGPGAVAFELAGRVRGASVVGLDQSPEMLGAGVRRLRGLRPRPRVRFVLGHGDRLPFPDGSFDAVTFTYLLRYVDDPASALRELTRVLRPGGVLANLEFAVPGNAFWSALWVAYTRVALPALGRLISRPWYEVGRFLGPSISGFYAEHPLVDQLAMWRGAGVPGVEAKVMSLGGGVVIWGTKAGDDG